MSCMRSLLGFPTAWFGRIVYVNGEGQEAEAGAHTWGLNGKEDGGETNNFKNFF